MHSIMGQDVANNREKIVLASHIVAKSYFLEQAVKCVVTALLLTSTSLDQAYTRTDEQ